MVKQQIEIISSNFSDEMLCILFSTLSANKIATLVVHKSTTCDYSERAFVFLNRCSTLQHLEMRYNMVKWNFTCIHLLHLIRQEQERYCNLSFQKTEESVLKHHLLSPSIYKIMQR